jgi:hypothetical protein
LKKYYPNFETKVTQSIIIKLLDVLEVYIKLSDFQ